MLAELSIDDLVLIAAARLEFSPGLNVITGETGAGKSLLAQAIGLLMGQKGGDELVRPGAARALVQALFENGDDSLAVARELPRGGRSRARMDGLLSSAAAVEEALRRRLAFYGQLEHTRLLQLERQLDLLDGAVADEVEPLKAAYAEAYAAARTLTRELDDLRGADRDRERELDMLRYQVAEIEAAGVEPGEDERLAVDRERARHAGKLLERTGGALALLAGESEAAALDGVRVAQRLVDEAALLDESLGAAGGASRRAHRGARRPLRGAARLHRRARRRRRPPGRAGAALRQAQGAHAQVRRLGRRGARVPRGGARPAPGARGVRRRRGVAGGEGRRRRRTTRSAPRRGCREARRRLAPAGRGAHRGGAPRPRHAARHAS